MTSIESDPTVNLYSGNIGDQTEKCGTYIFSGKREYWRSDRKMRDLYFLRQTLPKRTRGAKNTSNTRVWSSKLLIVMPFLQKEIQENEEASKA